MQSQLLKNDLIDQAVFFAAGSHAGCVRKYTGEPYIVHLAEVASLLASQLMSDATNHMLAACYLHDTVEDTAVTYDYLLKWFPIEVVKLVAELTDITTLASGNRTTRKAIERDRLAKVSLEAKNIKICDLVSNMRSIAEHDQKFYKVFKAEALQLMEVFQDADPRLIKFFNEEMQLLENQYGQHTHR